MHVAAIELEDFRSYGDRRLDLAPGVTAFVGPNGAGKTNILEAVHVIARGESSRAGDDVEMIRWGTPLARVAIDACRAQDRTRLEVTLFAPAADVRRRPRRYTADGAPRRADDVVGRVAVVAFFPEDTDLLASAPSARRRYLDAMVAQVDRSHRADVRAYANVVTQRNALLRAGRDDEPVSETEIAFWDTELVRLATSISLRRESAVREFRPAFRAAAAALGADPTPDVAYAGQVQGVTAEERSEGYRRLIVEKHDRERWQATTLVGPHREDLAVAVGERPLPTFASRGEQRSAVLALKLAEADWIEAHVGELPIFLLDDVLSELDTARRGAASRRSARCPRDAPKLATDATAEPFDEDRHHGRAPTRHARRDRRERTHPRSDAANEGPVLFSVRSRPAARECGRRCRERGFRPRAPGVLLRPLGRDRGLAAQSFAAGEPPGRAAPPRPARTRRTALRLRRHREQRALRGADRRRAGLPRSARATLPTRRRTGRTRGLRPSDHDARGRVAGRRR